MSVQIDVEHFGNRVIQDALSHALAQTWLRRADQLEAARPKPSEFHGKATSAEVAERDQRLARKAANCRDHATIVEFHDAGELIAEVLAGGDRHV